MPSATTSESAVADADPEPPPCPHGHTKTPANVKACPHCKAWRVWQQRGYRILRRAGVETTFSDLDTLAAHLNNLMDAGMLPVDIARRARCPLPTLGNLIGKVGDRKFVRAEFARRLLEIPVPERRLALIPSSTGTRIPRVDATGTHRRLQAACCAGHSLSEQSRRLGYADNTAHSWIYHRTVTVDVAERVAALYPTLIAQPGSNRAAVAFAAGKRWLAARYYSPANIDNPAYRPLAAVRSIGLRRELRALAWMAIGPKQVAEHTGEDPDDIARWMRGEPAPAYTVHLVDAAYDALDGIRFGPDDAAADEARANDWDPPMAWHGIDMHHPHARPHRNIAGSLKSEHPLMSQVYQAIDGQIPERELLKTEKIIAVRFLHEQGWSDRRIGAWLRWDDNDNFDQAAQAVCAFRMRQAIVGHGPGSSRTPDAQIIVPPGAYARRPLPNPHPPSRSGDGGWPHQEVPPDNLGEHTWPPAPDWRSYAPAEG